MSRNRTLGDLFEAVPSSHAALPVAGISADSRKVRPGFAFVAIPGVKADGAAFVPAALAAGATAVVSESERPPALPGDVAHVRVPDARLALAHAAARFYPRQPRTIVAVTGTAGKSSVADFTRQIYAALGHRAASIGTLGVVTSEGASYGSLTTPDPVSLHETLARLAEEGIEHVAMEASSHGLDQRRLEAVRLSAAAFTNLGRDHLDYHETMEAYLAAKMRLFTELLPAGAPAVINADGDYSERVAAAVAQRGSPIFDVGAKGRSIRLAGARLDGFVQHLEIVYEGRVLPVAFPLIGAFQIENALVAAALAGVTCGDIEGAIAALAGLEGVPGRLERVGEVRGALCVVDYAHKPEALAHVLASLRPFARGRLVCVFGCGGDRDRGKRPIMGRIAAEGADEVIVTDDNPRTEDPAAIRAAILAGVPDAREIGDRGEAIRSAVHALRPGDVLVVAGKGHETGQIVGDVTIPFSDHDAVRAAIAEIG